MKLRKYLDDNNLSVAAFALDVDVTVQALYRYMDESRMPRREILERITHATKGAVTANDFFGQDMLQKIDEKTNGEVTANDFVAARSAAE